MWSGNVVARCSGALRVALAAGVVSVCATASAAVPAVALGALAPATAFPLAPEPVSDTYWMKGVACPTASVCEAVGARFRGEDDGDGVVAEIAGPGEPIAQAHVPGVHLNDIACPSASRCVAVGQLFAYPFSGAVVSITDGKPGEPVITADMPALEAVDCASTSRCYAVHSAQGLTGAYRSAVVAITDGVPGTPTWLPDVGELSDVACAGSTTCYAVAADDVARVGALVPIQDGTVGPAQRVSVGLSGIACPSASLCLATGHDATASPMVGYVLSIADGTPGHAAPANGTQRLGSVACATSSSCFALADGGAVVPITDGAPGPPVPIPASARPAQPWVMYRIACRNSDECTAVGAGPSGNPVGQAYTGAVTRVLVHPATESASPLG